LSRLKDFDPVMAISAEPTAVVPGAPPAKKKVNFANLGVGAAMNMFEVTTLGQPFEVIKTQLAANRQDNMVTAFKKIYQRGGVAGFYQGYVEARRVVVFILLLPLACNSMLSWA
jgi:hypothetical protein